MQLSDYDYELPPELIAQEPLKVRSASRMLVVDRSKSGFEDRVFTNLPKILDSGDLVVINNTKVFPARLLGTTETGAGVEIFLVSPIEGGKWEALVRPARRLKPGKRVHFGDVLSARIEGRFPDGNATVIFDDVADLEERLEQIGKTPLPPYIKRDMTDADKDRGRYQTVFAKEKGAIAAPTAGLHFTPETLETLRRQKIDICEVTLHVGYGTFEPVRTTDLTQHTVRSEKYEITEDAAQLLNAARSDQRRIIAVGTTTTRTLENALSVHGKFIAERAAATLTITPGYTFKAIDGVVTNFHLPRSSLLILVSTFGGHELIMNAYRHAVASRYRFYSYGDCMLII